MDHKNKLEELNKEALARLEEYMQQRGAQDGNAHQQVHTAKTEWQGAWSKLMETLMVLERLEI